VLTTCLLWVQALGGGLGPLYNMQEVSGSSGDSSDSRSASDPGAGPCARARAGCMAGHPARLPCDLPNELTQVLRHAPHTKSGLTACKQAAWQGRRQTPPLRRTRRAPCGASGPGLSSAGTRPASASQSLQRRPLLRGARVSLAPRAGAPPPAGNGTALTPAVSIGQQTVTIQVAAVYLLLPAAAPAPAPGAGSALRAAGPAAGTAGR